jgi:MFS family permease
MSTKITQWLEQRNQIIFSMYAVVAAFCTYACMYAFRKPFTAAAFEGFEYWGVELKTLLIISQVFGYTISKFMGIKVVSEMSPNRRANTIVVLIVLAELALLLFWLVPGQTKILFLFLNGLPLGMVWGLVFAYLEGRRNTELLGAGLSVSFIVSSGIVKSFGRWMVLEFGVSEFAMPFLTGLIFLIPLTFFTWLLNKIPPPTQLDEELRTKRVPMNGKERIQFFKEFSVGIIFLTVVYMFLTAFRDLRDNYALEILEAVGFVDNAAIFTQTEAPIGLIVLIVMASIMLIKNNRIALIVNHYIIFFGIFLIGASTFAFQKEMISPYMWMVLVGLGSYLGYVPFNCILFDRFIATYRTVANAGFLIYIADSFGYLSSVGVLLYKNFGQSDISWYHFFVQFSYVMTVFGMILTLTSLFYFSRKKHHSPTTS